MGDCPDTVYNGDSNIHHADKYYHSSSSLDIEYNSRVLWPLLVFRNIMQGLKYLRYRPLFHRSGLEKGVSLFRLPGLVVISKLILLEFARPSSHAYCLIHSLRIRYFDLVCSVIVESSIGGKMRNERRIQALWN